MTDLLSDELENSSFGQKFAKLSYSIGKMVSHPVVGEMCSIMHGWVIFKGIFLFQRFQKLLLVFDLI